MHHKFRNHGMIRFDVMAEDSWNTQGQRAQAGLEPVRRLLGEWSGVGVCHDAAVTGHMSLTVLLDGSWIQAVETLLDATGQSVHTDLCLYRFDVENDTLVALQLFERGSQMSSPVEVLDDGFRWITGPGAPQLRFVSSADTFSYTVILPDEDAPVVEMTYKRA